MPKGHLALLLGVALGRLLVVKALYLLDGHIRVVYNALRLAEGLIVAVDLREKFFHQRTGFFVDLNVFRTYTKMERFITLWELKDKFYPAWLALL